MSDHLGSGYPSGPVPGELHYQSSPHDEPAQRLEPAPADPPSEPPPPIPDEGAEAKEEEEPLTPLATKEPAAQRVENAVMSYVLPLTAGGLLMLCCYGIGRYGYSFAWIGIFVALNFLKSKLWRHREKRVLALRQAATREREVIMAQLQDLPAWVQFPDIERVEWINKVIHQLWPYIGEYTKTFIAEFVEPQVKASLPSAFKSFHFQEIDMGDIPLRVGGIKVYTENVGRDRIIMDMDVAYAGDCNFVVAVGAFKGGLNQMQFKGKLRVILKPLLPFPPMVGGVTAFFLDDPAIDFNLTGLGEMVEIPGLMGAIRSVVTTQVRAICVLPNEIVVPLTADTDVAALHFPEPDGVVRIGVLEARDLENLDISFIKKGKSDPYAQVAVGAQHFQTKVKDDDLNPKWNEWFEAVVDQASGQKLLVEVFDEDAGKDEELGHLTLDLDSIRKRGVTDAWYQLEGAKKGEIRLKLHWMNLSTDQAHLSRDNWAPEWRNSSNPLHPAMLMTYVDCISDLPYPKRDSEPSPYVEIRVGNEKRKTFPKPKTVNPLFQHKELFFVSDPEHQDVFIEAFDDGTKKSLGEVKVPLRRLLAEPEMELYQQTFMLSLGAHSSPLVATLRLRSFLGKPAQASPVANSAALPPKGPHVERTSVAEIRRREDHLAAKPPPSPRPADKPPPSPRPESGLSPRAVKRGDKEKRPTRHHSDSRPLSEKPKISPPSPEKPTRHRSEMALGSAEKPTRNGSSVVSSPGSGTRQRRDSRSSTRSRASSLLSFGGRKKLIKRNKSFTGSNLGNIGRVELTLRYYTQSGKLVVTVVRCEGLQAASTDGTADPYVKVRLLRENSEKEEFKTRVVVGTLQPEYHQTFTFDVPPKGIEDYSLFVKVKDGASYGLFTKPPVLGKFLFPLDGLSPGQETTQLFDLSF